MNKFGNISINSGGGGVALGDNSTAYGRNAIVRFAVPEGSEAAVRLEPEALLTVQRMISQLSAQLSKSSLPGADDALLKLGSLDMKLAHSGSSIAKQEVATSLQSVCNISGIASNLVAIAASIGAACGLIAN